MGNVAKIVVAGFLVLACSVAGAYSIPKDQQDHQKLYWGVASQFDKAGEVRFQALIEATPEYQELKKKKVEERSAKYWILLSQASDRVVRIIAKVGEDTDYDLIAAQGYLGSLDPAIPADDITALVIKVMEQDAKG